MSLAEPLHVNSEPRDGFYWIWGKAPDPSKPMTARPKIPIKIWTVVTVDEVGDRIDDDRQYIQVGHELCSVSQEEWLFFAKHPITQEDYEAMFITGDWK
jgi:hypothetical protein